MSYYNSKDIEVVSKWLGNDQTKNTYHFGKQIHLNPEIPFGASEFTSTNITYRYEYYKRKQMERLQSGMLEFVEGKGTIEIQIINNSTNTKVKRKLKIYDKYEHELWV